MMKSMPPQGRQTTATTSLGYGRYGAAMNMAIDEAMSLESAQSGRIFLRFYDFTKPSIILCEHDSKECLKLDNLDGVDITRRKTGGRPLYVTDNSLEYAVAIPISEKDGWAGSLHDVHTRFGGLAADAIASVAGIGREELSLPRTSSIRFNGRSLAGHAQRLTPGQFLLYEGLVVVEPYDVGAIDKLWRLEKEDLDRIGQLPSIRSIARRKLGTTQDIKDQLMDTMTQALTGGSFEHAQQSTSASILASAERLSRQLYGNPEWVMSDQPSRTHKSPFCMLWEENESPRQRNP